MNVSGTPYRTVWLEPDARTVKIIDQRPPSPRVRGG